MEIERRGLLLILSSPSGAGKSTLSHMLLEWDTSLVFSVSATTRPPRKGEVEGQHYFFTSKDDFESMVEAGEMLEYAEVFGNYYGSPKALVERAINMGRDVVFDVDWQGWQQIKSSSMVNDAVPVFILPPSIAALEERLNNRAQDSAQVVAKRMSMAQAEIKHWKEYDYLIINKDLQISFEKLKSIIIAERSRRYRQLNLDKVIQDFNREFRDNK